jgi:DNA-directed RNA polymerase alpha subunit
MKNADCLDDPIEVLELPIWVYGVLKRQGITTVGQLIASDVRGRQLSEDVDAKRRVESQVVLYG